MRQPWPRRAIPKQIRPRSCSSPLGHAKRARGPLAAVPAAGESQQPAADQAGREMLLGDRRASVRPALAEVDEIGHDHLGDHRCDAEVGEQTIEHGVRADIIEPPQRLGETRAPILDPVLCGAGMLWPADAGASPAGVESTASAACRADTPAASSCLHRSHPALVLRSVQAKAPGAAQRLEQPVAALPCSQQGGRLAHAVAELADANTRSRLRKGHRHQLTEYTHLLQTLDNDGR